MARKRDAYTRARDRRKRPKSPAPRDGFLIGDVTRLTAIPVCARRGTITRYSRGEVLRLLGALRLKARTRAMWAEIKRKLDAFTESQLSAWLAQQRLAPTVAAELGMADLTQNRATS